MQNENEKINWELPKQTFLVENGVPGDCWRCCVAAVLQLPATRVPHFLMDAKAAHRDMDELTKEWLSSRALVLIKSDRLFVPAFYQDWFTPIPVIACGPTERSRGMGKHHAVVTINDRVVYDPHPSNAGLTAVTDRYVILGALNYQPSTTDA